MNYLKNQKGFTVFEIVLVVLLWATISVAGYFAYQSQAKVEPATTTTQQPAKDEAKPAANPGETEEDLFFITLPAGWSRLSASQGGFPKCADKSYNYGDKQGNYFDVCADPYGMGVSTDAGWDLVKAGSGFKIASEGAQCTRSEEAMFCSSGDGKFNLGMSAIQNDGPVDFNGHTYFFHAGNTIKETGVDLSPYRSILTSIRIK